jgi:hypothetical protein
MTRFLLALFLALTFVASAQSAVLLPNGKQQFINGNGVPLASGSVYFYVPGTTTPKTTWQDSGATTPNTNPVQLDSNGMATIYGTGTYREVVYDVNNNLLFDALTSDGSGSGGGSSATVLWCGSSTGSGNAQICTNSSFTNTDGQIVYFYASYTNTGSMTLSVSGNTYAVYKDVPTGQTALSGGEVVAGTVNGVVYSATSGHWQLVTNNAPSFSIIGNLTAAATTNLGSVTSNVVNVTGSGVSITSFGSTATNINTIYFVKFAAANTIVYNATGMITPSGGNMNVNPGDAIIAQYNGAGHWIVLGQIPALGPQVNEQTGPTYTVQPTDIGDLLYFTPSSATTITIPQATTSGIFGPGAQFWVKNNGTAIVTLSPTTSNIDGATTLTLYPGFGVGVHSDGTDYYTDAVPYNRLYQATSVTASGTSISFTSVPSWAKRITITLSGVTLSVADTLQVQIGPSGGLETTGYTGLSAAIIGGGGAVMTTSGFTCNGMGTATGPWSGTAILMNSSGNIWEGTVTLSTTSGTNIVLAIGAKSLAGILTQISLKGVGGQTFSGGTVAIYYE